MKHIHIFLLSILSIACYGAASSSNTKNSTECAPKRLERSNSFPPAKKVVGLSDGRKKQREHAQTGAAEIVVIAQRLRDGKDPHYDPKTGSYIPFMAHAVVTGRVRTWRFS